MSYNLNSSKVYRDIKRDARSLEYGSCSSYLGSKQFSYIHFEAQVLRT